jgi:hypothetical protein
MAHVIDKKGLFGSRTIYRVIAFGAFWWMLALGGLLTGCSDTIAGPDMQQCCDDEPAPTDSTDTPPPDGPPAVTEGNIKVAQPLGDPQYVELSRDAVQKITGLTGEVTLYGIGNWSTSKDDQLYYWTATRTHRAQPGEEIGRIKIGDKVWGIQIITD